MMIPTLFGCLNGVRIGISNRLLSPTGGCMSDAYFPLNTGVKSLQSSTLNARMSLTESLNQGVFFNASIAMYRLAMSLFADRYTLPCVL